MEKLITVSTDSPGIETVGDLTISVVPPCNENEVTVVFGVHVHDFHPKIELPGVEFTNTIITSTAKHGTRRRFDFKDSHTHTVTYEGKDYTLKLLRTDLEHTYAEPSRYYEFLVTFDG